MPNIPGLPISGGIPNLGQGVRGGAAGLQGLPGARGASNIPGLPSLAAVPRVAIPSGPIAGLPAPAVLHPNTMLDSGAMDHTKERLDRATQILMRVRAGQMEPKKAAKLLDDLTTEERKTLTKTVLDHHAAVGGPNPQAELQALRYLPVDAKAHSATMTQRPAGIGTNLLRDAVGAVTGMPAGIALAGKAVVEDSIGQVTHPGRIIESDPRKRFPETYGKIVKPVAKSYADTYGPVAHGDFSGLERHPLQPILDAASLVSAGLGTAGRAADASAALRAGRVQEVPRMIESSRVAKTTGGDSMEDVYHGSYDKVPHGSLSTKMGQEDDVYGRGLYGTSAKEVAQYYAGEDGTLHHLQIPSSKIIQGELPPPPEMMAELRDAVSKHAIDPNTALARMNHPSFKAQELIGETPALTSAVHKVFEKHGYVGMKYPSYTVADDIANMAGLDHPAVRQVDSSHEYVIWDDKILKDVPKVRKAPAVARVGDEYGIHEHAPKAGTGDALGINRVSHETPLDGNIKQAILRTAQEVGSKHSHEYAQEFVKGLKEDLTKPPEYQAYIAHEIPGTAGDATGDFPILDHLNQAFSEAVGRGADDAGTGFGAGEHRWYFDNKAEAEAAAQKLDEVAKSFGLKSDDGESLAQADVLAEQPETLGEVVANAADRGKNIEKKQLKPEYQHIEDKVQAEWGKSQPFFHEFLDSLTKNLHSMGYRGEDLIGPHSTQPGELHPTSQSALDRLRPERVTKDAPQRFSVRKKNGQIVAQNFPDKESAIKHAQSLISPYKSPLEAFIKGGGDRGRLIDRYESKRGYNHTLETTSMMKEIADVLDKPDLRVDRRSFREVLKEVGMDLKETRAQGKARGTQIAADNPSFYSALPVRKSLAVGETALREASDLVRAGAIYLRPAYLPNNWAGNFFMNSVHQGVLAPINLAKSLVMSKHMDPQNLAALRKSMGQNAAEVVTSGKGRGYVGSITNPVAHSMGMLADQPFRDAAFLHEARRAGYNKLSKVDDLFHRARRHASTADGQKALQEIATIGRKAQEEIVKFGHMNDAEQSVLRNLIFVYSWVRGAARYAGRFALQHPIQANAYSHLSEDVGNPFLAKELGGVPNYLAGAIPVGHDSKGNPILINPFSLNPLGTAVDVGRAVAGTLKVIRHPKDFNKYVDSDITNITNPLIQSYVAAREGGKDPISANERSIAPLRLINELRHPGSGSVFPTSRTEALGHYTVGALFPRVADQAALTRSLERQQANDPIARIPADMKAYKKMTGSDLPDDMVGAYKGDLEQVQMMKDFQIKYASDHGQSGFRNLPPANRLDAAIKFLEKYKLASKDDIASYKDMIPELTSDADMNSFANTLFSSTGIGQYKSQWDSLMRDARGLRVTRKKP